MGPLRVILMRALASCQRLESPDVDCEEGFVCREESDCPFYLERKEHLGLLKSSGSGAEYDTVLATLKDMVCNKAERGVCCRESFELVNGNIVENVEELPFIGRYGHYKVYRLQCHDSRFHLHWPQYNISIDVYPLTCFIFIL